MSSTRKTVLVTGASGLIGSGAAEALSRSHHVRALNRRSTPRFETVQADVTDFNTIRPAFEGVDTVVHLSALLIQVPDRDLLKVNVEGTYNVFEAARQAGVKRVVFASTGSVMGGYFGEEPFRSLMTWTHPEIPAVAARLREVRRDDDFSRPWRVISHLDPVRPSNFYSFTKLSGEAMGRFFHEKSGMSVICIRFGAVFAEDRPPSAGASAVYMSRRDATQVVVKSVEAPPGVGYEVFFALSDNAARFRDIAHAHAIVGFTPEDGVLAWESTK